VRKQGPGRGRIRVVGFEKLVWMMAWRVTEVRLFELRLSGFCGSVGGGDGRAGSSRKGPS
jgi:hypothetical protein